MTFATLTEAIEWGRSHWAEQRPVPIRIHSHETEGIGLFYAPAFAAAMDGSPAASVTVTIPNQPCYHPTLMRGDSPFQCSECHGSGVKDHRTDRYLYPMSLALTRLATVPPVRRHLHPYALVVALVSAGWDWRSAARSIDRSEDAAEALFLLALRKLRSRYQEGPGTTRTSVAWVDLSESAQNAVFAGETAA